MQVVKVARITYRYGRTTLNGSITRLYSTTTTNTEINSLSDLVKLKSLDNVDPALVQKLINEKTTELNLQNEIKRLQMLQSQNEKKNTFAQPVTLSNFKRAGIMFALMSSSVYLCWQLLWWNLSYDSKEKDNLYQVAHLQDELHRLIELNQLEVPSTSDVVGSESPKNRSWISKWW